MTHINWSENKVNYLGYNGYRGQQTMFYDCFKRVQKLKRYKVKAVYDDVTGNLSFIQKLVLEIMDLFGLLDFKFNPRAVDYNDIANAVKEQMISVMSCGLKPKYILIGPNDKFGYSYNEYKFPEYYDINFYPLEVAKAYVGMKVIVVPWMEGMLVLPEL